ncbi:MAG TPA: IS21 family transposase [Acidimicrobiales bacterium]|nr:IS21 family transposase [Acidimicrobiales bacterium]
MKHDREIMEILEAFDLTKCAHSAAALCGADPKTVGRYVALRVAGVVPGERPPRPKIIDPFLEKIEELVDRSGGKIRADIVHADHIVPMGFTGNERTTRRAIEAAKARYAAGHRRTFRPWVPEPGMWLQWDWGHGPQVENRQTQLFCAWLAWSRFRVVLPTWDKTLPTVLTCLDTTLRRLGAAPTYLLTDNEKTVSVAHVAGLAVRHPEMVGFGRHYGLVVRSCVPDDPQTKGGSEATVRIAKADLVPTAANLRDDYESFAELDRACVEFGERVNALPHAETRRPPVELLEQERQRMHVLPSQPYTAALGETRIVRDEQTVRWGNVRYSVPEMWVGREVWCRVHGDDLVISGRHPDGGGLVEVWRHQLSTPGRPVIVDAHYPNHPPGNEPKERAITPRSDAERGFLALGDGAERWLREACATGAPRIPTKMASAVELACLIGAGDVDRALGMAALAGRFADDDLTRILEHLDRASQVEDIVIADEEHSTQPGTSAWADYGTGA